MLRLQGAPVNRVTTAAAPTSVSVHPTQPHLAVVSLANHLSPVLVDFTAGTSASIHTTTGYAAYVP
jgi:hypothetical protein